MFVNIENIPQSAMAYHTEFVIHSQRREMLRQGASNLLLRLSFS
jgi:hypothetical protein